MLFNTYPGYSGRHTRDQAPGAIPNGTRIVKRNAERGDLQRNGALGIVLGSFKTPATLAAASGVGYFYFVEWDRRPRVAVGVISTKITPLLAR